MKTLHKDIVIPKLEGSKTIARADDIFEYIDSDFENWGTDKRGSATDETKFAVQEMTKDATFKQLFTKPDEMVMSQEQIIWYCKNYRNLLHNWYTFFLFKVGNQLFVACVFVYSDGGLGAGVVRLSGDGVWGAEGRRRVVVPKLALEPLESEILSSFDTLPPCILDLQKRVKELEEKLTKIKELL